MSDLPRRPTHGGVWIEVERCAGCDGHKDITRHREEKYKEYAKRLEIAINGILQDKGIRCIYEVNPGPVPPGDGKYQAMMGNSYYYQKMGSDGIPQRFRYPGLGAFEVYMCLGQRREQVFSKLKSRKWPNPEGLANKIDEEVGSLFGGWEGEGADHKSSSSRADVASPAACIADDAVAGEECEEEKFDHAEADTAGYGASSDNRSIDKTADAEVTDTAPMAPDRAAEAEVRHAAPTAPVPTADPPKHNALEREEFEDDFEDDIVDDIADDVAANVGEDPAATFGKLPHTRGHAADVELYDNEYDDFEETTPTASASLAETRANMFSTQNNGSIASGLDVTKRPQTASTAASASDIRDHNSSTDDFSFGGGQTLPRSSGPKRPMSASPTGRRSVHDMPPNVHGDLGRVDEEDQGREANPRIQPPSQPSDALAHQQADEPEDPPRGQQPLKVIIISARNVKDNDWFLGGSDVYVECEIPNKPKSKAKTAVSKEKDPVWNCEVKIPNYSVGDSLQFTLWDDDTFSDDCLGRVFLDSARFHPNGFQGELMLDGRDKRDQASYLSVRVGDPTSSSAPAPWRGPESPAPGRGSMGTMKHDTDDDVDEYEDEGFEED